MLKNAYHGINFFWFWDICVMWHCDCCCALIGACVTIVQRRAHWSMVIIKIFFHAHGTTLHCVSLITHIRQLIINLSAIRPFLDLVSNICRNGNLPKREIAVDESQLRLYKVRIFMKSYVRTFQVQSIWPSDIGLLSVWDKYGEKFVKENQNCVSEPALLHGTANWICEFFCTPT